MLTHLLTSKRILKSESITEEERRLKESLSKEEGSYGKRWEFMSLWIVITMYRISSKFDAFRLRN